MLQTALKRSRQQMMFAQMCQMRNIQTVAGKNYATPESINDIIKYLDDRRPTYTLLYFSADWNPMCAKIQKDYENLTRSQDAFMHIKVDCDATPMVKRYFDCQVEPQFLFLVNGGEIHRQVGYNFNLIDDLCQKTIQHHRTEFAYVGSTSKQWERFYDFYDKWAKHGESDRDVMRVQNDNFSDSYRGPGTSNPQG